MLSIEEIKLLIEKLEKVKKEGSTKTNRLKFKNIKGT